MNMQNIIGGVSGLPDHIIILVFWSSLVLTGLFLLLSQRRVELRRRSDSFRHNLLAFTPLYTLIKKRPFQFSLQVFSVLFLILIIATGLFGVQSGPNLAPVATWTIWWALLIFDIVLLGRSWCMVCPWYALATWLRRLSFWKRTSESFCLNLPWPDRFKNLYLAVALFIILTWLELGFEVVSSPLATAILALLMTSLVVFPALVFKGMSFCRYGCLVGRICGLYALIAPIELRARDLSVCQKCQTRDCRYGNKQGYPCPTDLDLARLQKNSYCLNCTECIKSCQHDNVALNLRPLGSDLARRFTPQRDEAYLAIVLFAMTSFHGLTMTRVWGRLVGSIVEILHVPYLLAFSLGMMTLLLALMTMFALAAHLHYRLEISIKATQLPSSFVHFAYALIPLTLCFHLAHNAAHFLNEGSALLIVLSDPFGWGWDLFGTAANPIRPMLSAVTSAWLQAALILTGYGLSLKVLLTISRQRSSDRMAQGRSMLVIGSILLVFQLFNLWLLAQPMIMRTRL